MSKEKKIVELKDEELEKVTGGKEQLSGSSDGSSSGNELISFAVTTGVCDDSK